MYLSARFLVFLAALAATPALAAPPPVAGEYDSPLGRVRVTGDGDTFRGTVVAPRKGVALRPGDAFLEATLLDDSLAGRVRVPFARTKGCAKPEAWVNAVLLVSTEGLSGAVHLPKGCRGPTGKNGGLTFARPGAKVAAPALPPPDPAEVTPAPRPRPRPPAGAPGGKKAARERALAELQEGAAYLQEGNFEQARRRFLAAIEEDAGVPEAYNGVGVTYRMRNDLPRALDWYKRSLAVNPDFGDAYYNMACVYALQGEKELALRYLQIAALNGYVAADTMDQDPDLELLRGEAAYQALLRQH